MQVPTEKRHCEFIDLWTSARFVREDNPDYVPNVEIGSGWVWRGGTHIPLVVWKDSCSEGER